MTDLAPEETQGLLITLPDDPEHGFTVTDDTTAEWALERMREHTAEVARIKANAEEAIDRIRSKADHDCAQSARRIDYLHTLLVDYRRQLEEQDPSLPKTYRLPSGNLKRRAGSESVQIADPDAFIEWARDGRLDLLRLTPAKDAIKRATTVTEDGTLVSADGEVLPGVTITRGPDSYSVEVS